MRPRHATVAKNHSAHADLRTSGLLDFTEYSRGK